MKKLVFLFLIGISTTISAQEKQAEIQWMDFETLEASLKLEPKPVFIYFYADWCVYCKKMEKHAFRNSEIQKILANDYYSVKMNAESTDSINFDGKVYINEQAKTQRRGTHQIPLILASRKNQKFSLPALLVLDENFRIKKRSFEYLTSEKLKELITD